MFSMYVEGSRCWFPLVVCPGVFVLHFFFKKRKKRMKENKTEKKRKIKDLLIVDNIFNQASYKTKTHRDVMLISKLY